MSIIKRSPLKLMLTVPVVLCLVLGLAACAPKAADSNDAGSSTSRVSADGSGEFVSDEQCLSCHGGTYEALAEKTAQYGESNPHNSIHGGYNSCVNCHVRDKEISDNQCMKCHDWPHNPEAA